MVFGISDGGAVEYPARVEHHNGGENQTQPLPARELSGRHHRDNHDGQGENRCDDEAGDEIAASFSSASTICWSASTAEMLLPSERSRAS
ncbi:MAG: hypothetical protein U1U88_000862 [Lawsonella clevelandensis]